MEDKNVNNQNQNIELISYKKSDIETVVNILNTIPITGINNINAFSTLSNILINGKLTTSKLKNETDE